MEIRKKGGGGCGLLLDTTGNRKYEADAVFLPQESQSNFGNSGERDRNEEPAARLAQSRDRITTVEEVQMC